MGFSGTIRRLKDALRKLRDLLELPWVVENPDEEATDWREEATELCYDLEDAIAKYSSSVTSSPSADEQAQEALDQLRGRAMDALSEFNKLALRESSSSSCVDQIEDEADDASFPVGMKDPTEKIIELLNLRPRQREDKAHKVVSIVGLAGSGKSTLAAQVYKKIADKFQCKARVFVMQKPNVKGILINLLQKLGGNGDKLDDLHELTLVRLIQEHVHDKRFLVLAEGVWDENTWMIIRCALSHNNSGGRIIITTRINYIASLGDSVYRICPLSKEDSKSLLLKNVQLSLSDDTLDKILEKCGGLPLAIIAMSDVLKNAKSAEDWEKMYSFMNSAEDSINSMRRKLSLGYYELSYHLRMCLLYLSIFPARHEIKRKRLVHRWIAQGLVHAQYGENATEKATCYFNELINRNWIEAVNIKSDGQARACRVHNVILDFIIYKSAEENFVTLVGASPENKEEKKKIHNLSIQYSMQDSTKLGEASHVRSLTVFGKFKLPPCPLESDVLRVLDLEDYYPAYNGSIRRSGIKTSSLLHLRYLSVRAAGISGLREVAKMRHLEILDLGINGARDREGCVVRVQQELDITGLQQLVRLFVDSETTLKAEIKNMMALEEVKYISISKHSEGLLKELGQLTKLRVLGIHLDAGGETPDGQKKAMAIASSLHKLGNSELDSLYIDGSWEVSLNLTTSDGDSRQPTLPFLQKLKFRKWCYVNEVPGWMASLQNLGILRLGISKMKQDQLAILGALPCLLDLFLDILEVHGKEIMFEELTGFRYLKCLGISCRTRMKVTFGENSVPCLEHLKLHVDVRAGVVPEGCKFIIGIEHLSSLTKFDALIYCVRATDPVVKHVKDEMRKEAGNTIATELTEKEERNTHEGAESISVVYEAVKNLEKDQVRKLESAQIDIKKLQGLLEETRRFLMMLLDDENPKHQVVEWTNIVRDLLLGTHRILMPSLPYFSSSSLPRLRFFLKKRLQHLILQMESLPPKKSSGLSSLVCKASEKSEQMSGSAHRQSFNRRREAGILMKKISSRERSSADYDLFPEWSSHASTVEQPVIPCRPAGLYPSPLSRAWLQHASTADESMRQYGYRQTRQPRPSESL